MRLDQQITKAMGLYLETKKNPNVDLERFRPLVFSFSLMLTMVIVSFTFKYKVYDSTGEKIQLQSVSKIEDEMEEVPSTVITPPPPTLQVSKLVEVPDTKKIEEEIKMNLDMELSEQQVNEEITIMEAPKVEEEVVTDAIFVVVEQVAVPRDGLAGFYKYVSENIQYSAQAKRMGIQGKVYVEFVVEKDGSLTQLKVVKGIGAGCDEEALRIIRNSSNWIPAKQRGRPVRQRMVFPIHFKLME